MTNTYQTRRRFLTVAGSVLITGVAGCSGTLNPGGDSEKQPGNNQERDLGDNAEWEGIDEFYFEGRIPAWTAIEPAKIEGEDNPAIVLFEGEEYDFRWVNKDGAIHDLEIWDDNGDIVDGYATESADTEDEELVLTNVIASQEMTTYVCNYHRGTQAGEIVVRSLDG